MNAESTREALDVASLAGDILLASGAEIFRVEETIDRIARAYGVDSSDAFVLSSGIFPGEYLSNSSRFSSPISDILRVALLREVSSTSSE